ncbi:hypothetical protein ACT3UJ_06615 [Halomonas sp. 86]|uniref:hypothetical protein n=1 Tax=unclassified Halomonas TaxID=2609666 RepID=UPI0040347A18
MKKKQALQVIREYRAAFYQVNGRLPIVTEKGREYLVEGGTRYTAEKLRELTGNLRWRLTGDRDKCSA